MRRPRVRTIKTALAILVVIGWIVVPVALLCLVFKLMWQLNPYFIIVPVIFGMAILALTWALNKLYKEDIL